MIVRLIDSYNYFHEFHIANFFILERHVFLGNVWWFILPSTLLPRRSSYISRFFHKLRLIIYAKSVRQHVVLRDVPISTTGCRTLRNGYRSPSFAIWFMTAGDRLPSYPQAKEEQFVSALDLMGLSTRRSLIFVQYAVVDFALISKSALKN